MSEETQKQLEEDMDNQIADNKEDLLGGFIEEYNAEWKNFCKIKWNEENA